MRIKISFILFSLCILFAGQVISQINPTDGCGPAPALPVNTTCVNNAYNLPASFNNNAVIEPSCGAGVGQNQEDGFYTFVATGTSTTIDLTGNLGHSIAVYSGCPPTLANEVACAIAAAGNTASVTFPTTIGNTYYVQIHRKSGGNGVAMTGNICINSPVAGTNDNPCTATVLAVGVACVFNTFTNAGSTASPGVPAPGCANYVTGDVWFQVTVPVSGNLIFDSNVGVITDGGMAIYSGTCGALSLLSCNDDGSVNGLMPMISQPGLTPGATIWIRFWEYGGDNNGTFNLCVYDGGATPPTPVNDNPCSATVVAVNASCTFSTYTNANATATGGVVAPGCASYSGGDVWFQVTVPPSGALAFDTNTGVITDGGMAIYSGTCGALTQIACDDDGSTNGAMPFITNGSLTPGATIWIRIWEFGGDNNGTFNLCVYETAAAPPPGTNVVCGGMEPICSNTPITFTAGVGGTAASVANPGNNYGCLFTSPNPTWFYMSMLTSGVMAINMSAGSDIDFAMWGPFTSLANATANCNSMGAPIDCSYSISATEQANLPAAVAGQVYVLLVTNYANVAQVIDLNTAVGNTATTDCSIILPIDLVNIFATTEYSSNTLHWTTLSETSNDKFIVERSYNGTDFSEIAMIDGAGNSSVENEYEFIDRNYSENLVYYRLKQIDFDGVSTHSNIVTVNRDLESILIYPNPTTATITIDFPINQKGNFTVKYSDVLGKEFYEKIDLDETTKSFSSQIFDQIPAGTYFVEIRNDDGTLISVQRIVKAK